MFKIGFQIEKEPIKFPAAWVTPTASPVALAVAPAVHAAGRERGCRVARFQG